MLADSNLLDAGAIQTGRMEAAIEQLYRAHWRRAARLGYLLTGDRGAAEELVQEAFVRVLGRLRAIRDPDALRAYVDRTIVNLAKNHHRGANRLRAFLAQKTQPAAPTTMPDIESRLELHETLFQLPYRQRAAVVLRYCEDLSEHDVAEVLGTTAKAVRSLVGRGLATLRASNGRRHDG